MAYGPSLSDTYRRAATYVDRILKGASRAISRSSGPRSSIVVNLRTAKALGLTIRPRCSRGRTRSSSESARRRCP